MEKLIEMSRVAARLSAATGVPVAIEMYGDDPMYIVADDKGYFRYHYRDGAREAYVVAHWVQRNARRGPDA